VISQDEPDGTDMDSPARFIDPCTLLEKINTARDLVGAALLRCCDLITASRLLQTDGVQLLVGQFKEIFHDGKLDLSIHESSNEGQNPGQKSLTSLPSPFRLRLLFGTSLVQLDGMLKALDLSGHPATAGGGASRYQVARKARVLWLPPRCQRAASDG